MTDTIPAQHPTSPVRIGRRAALIALSLAPLAVIDAPPQRPEEARVAAASIQALALGAWVAGDVWNGANLDRYMALTGSAPSHFTWYQDWAHGGFDPTPAEIILARNAVPILTWMPEDYTLEGKPQPDYTLNAIISGRHDDFIRTFANDVAGWGKLLYIRFAHEMNDNAYSWAIGANGNKRGEYVPMWRHVHDVFNDVGVENVKWVWCPNVTFNGAKPFDTLYPNDDYVDVLALDVYNFGTVHSWSRWASFTTIFQDSYKMITDLNDDKPLIIGEMGSVEQGGDKADWIRRAFLRDIPEKFNRVRAALWFNEDRSPEEGDWRVNTSPESLQAFEAVARSPLYQGKLP